MPLVTLPARILDAIANGQVDSKEKTLDASTKLIAIAQPGTPDNDSAWQMVFVKTGDTEKECRYVGGTNEFCYSLDVAPCLRFPFTADDIGGVVAEKGFVVKDTSGVRKRISAGDDGKLIVDPVEGYDPDDIEIPAFGSGLVCRDANGVYWRGIPIGGAHPILWEKAFPDPSGITVTTSGKGFLLKSANGTVFRLTPSTTGQSVLDPL